MYGYLFIKICQNMSPPFPEVGSERQAMKGKRGNVPRQHHHPARLEKRTRRENERPAVKVAVSEERKIVSPLLVTETVT